VNFDPSLSSSLLPNLALAHVNDLFAVVPVARIRIRREEEPFLSMRVSLSFRRTSQLRRSLSGLPPHGLPERRQL